MLQVEIPQITTADIIAELSKRKYNKIDYTFPDAGVLRRELYAKHMEVITKTASFRQVCMMAANRVGKSELGAYIVTCHLTGNYPHWWDGKRFNKPVSIIAAGETGTLVRDSLQEKLLGPPNDLGSGLIRKENIEGTRPRAGIPNAIDTAVIRHKSGGSSVLQFQSYDQGREKFQATARHVIWCDEEPPLGVYTEMLLRTMTTDGLVLSTFTPLKGVSETVLYLREQEKDGNAAIITATWDDAPHLTQEQKDGLWRALPPHQRDARSKGVPALGSGAIYPIIESDFVIKPIPIPKHWKHCYGLDVGWNNTAACWAAIDPDTDTAYIYADYKRGKEEPAIHAAAIKAKGEWIPGVIDPASRGRSQKDGEQLIALYRQQGLKVTEANNGVESGIFDVYERLCTGRLKVFHTCQALLEEYRLYRRDEKGKIVKEHDHILDALRYLVKSGIALSKANITTKQSFQITKASGGWMS
jgi:phage terminase large subunit-like protein